MRFTLEPGGDVEVPDGVRLVDVRPSLEGLLGEELPPGTLTIGGRHLADGSRAGTWPWVAGSVVLRGAGTPASRSHGDDAVDTVAAAVTAPWHVAVVAGPDTGSVAVPGRDGTVRIGRSSLGSRSPDAPTTRADVTGAEDRAGALGLSDPMVSRRHASIRVRRWRGSGRPRLVVRDHGSANGTTLDGGGRAPWRREGAGWWRTGGWRAGRWRAGRRGSTSAVGDRIHLGSTVLELRGPVRLVHGRPCVSGSTPDVALGSPARRPVPDQPVDGTPTLPASAWLVPAVVSVALAVVTRSPVLLALALSGPLMALLPRLSRWHRSRRPEVVSGTPGGPTAEPTTGRSAGRTTGGATPGGAPCLGPDAAATSVLLAAACVGWSAGSTSDDDPRRATGGTPVAGSTTGSVAVAAAAAPWWPLAREGLALVGTPAVTASTARVLVGAALIERRLALTVALPDGGAGWDWLRWTGDRSSGTGAVRSGAPHRDPVCWAARTARELSAALGGAPHSPHLVLWDGQHPGDETADRPIVPPGPPLEGRLDLGATGEGLLREWLTAGTTTSHGAVSEVTDAPADGDRAALVLVGALEDVPTWCRWIVRLAHDGSGVLVGPRGEHRVRVPGAPPSWAERHGRRLARQPRPVPATDPPTLGEPSLTSGPGSGSSPSAGSAEALPGRVGLADLGTPSDVGALLTAWGHGSGPHAATRRARPLRSLSAVIGQGPCAEPVEVDLVADGPHALVAGTTGAGKSELLQSLVLGLALRHPPDELAVVLVDYKGGASFGACRALPHVVGEVTDLDPRTAARALAGVRAELRHRKALLAEARVGDLETLRGAAASPGTVVPPRLLVVVDEFRAMAEDLPDFVPGLIAVAAQGRSLGIHLVLATQRPAGAVSAQMRANIALRLCLRVTGAADSLDVVDVPDAAHLPAAHPGRAVLRRGDAAPQLVQTAWAALPPSTACGAPAGQPAQASPLVAPRPAAPFTAAPPTAAPPATGAPPAAGAPLAAAAPAAVWAPDWSAFGRVPPPPDTPDAALPDHSRHLVATAQHAARLAAIPAPSPVWLPALPAVLRRHDMAAALVGRSTPERSLVLGLTDLPADRARGLLCWDASAGALAVVARARSGRTTALRTAVHAALSSGWQVHVVTGAVTGEDWQREGRAAHPGLGTVVAADDPARMAELLVQLHGALTGPHHLLVVDDVRGVQAALARLPRGAATDLLEPLVRDGRHRGVSVVLSGAPADVARLLPLVAERLVLAVDSHDDALLGVPRDLAGDRAAPGHGVHLGAGTAAACQVALPGGTDAVCAARATPSPPPAPVRLRPLPLRVRHAELGTLGDADGRARGSTAGPWAAIVGVGWDEEAPVRLDLAGGGLVVGPPGSGRSSALATVTLALRSGGRRVVSVARHGPGASAAPGASPGPGGLRDHAASATEALVLLRGLAAGATTAEGTVAVLDDLDLLVRAEPALDELLAGWVLAAEAGDPTVPRVVASARTDRAAAGYRGTVAALRSTAPSLVLSPATPGSTDVAGTDLSLCVDPVRPAHPGRGVVVERGRLTVVQVATA